MWTLFVLLAGLTLKRAYCEVTTDSIGVCQAVLTDTNMNFDQFATENGGKWEFKKRPTVTHNPDMDRIYSMEIKKSVKYPGSWDATIYYRSNDCKPAILIDGVLNNALSGHGSLASTVGKKTIQFNISFLKYVPGKYVYLYICSDAGKNHLTDYRFVATAIGGKLTPTDEADIKKIEDEYKFKSPLKAIDLRPCKK